MQNLSIAQLASLVEGQLTFGLMSPLGGECEPVRRLVLPSDEYQPGDVVVDVDQQLARGFAEEVFAKGAMGLIIDRPATPWAGCFVIETANVAAAMAVQGLQAAKTTA